MAYSATSEFAGVDHAALYKKYRPKPNPQILERIMTYLKETKNNESLNLAVDIACGSGQSTEMLSPHFRQVLGFDISEAQIAEAQKSNTLQNVSYRVADALHIPVDDDSVDLVTCSQALHWLNISQFCKEVDRILAPNGCLAAFSFTVDEILHENETIAKKSTEIFQEFFFKTLGPYWDEHHVLHESRFRDLTLPFSDFQRQSFEVDEEIPYSTFLGYSESISTVQRFLQKNPGSDLLESFQSKLSQTLGVDASAFEQTIRLKNWVVLLLGRKPCQNPAL